MTTDGFDFPGLASPHWNIADTVKFLTQLSTPIAIGTFDTPWPNSFNPHGDPRTNINALVATGKVSALKVGVWWDKTHSTNPHAICPMNVLQARAPLWQKWAVNHPHIQLYLSHSIEYSEHSLSEIQKRVDCIKHLCPAAVVVSCPIGGPNPPPIAPNTSPERHGKSAVTSGSGIASFDGNNCYDENVVSWLKHNTGVIRLLWGGRCNLDESGSFINCDKRTATPDFKYLKSMDRLRYSPGIAPIGSTLGKLTPFDTSNIYKTHGEDGPGDKDIRDNKPCLIVAEKAAKADVVTFDGQVIGELGYYSPFLDNRNRYYSGSPHGSDLYGYEFAQLAKQKSGSEFVGFRVNGTVYGLQNPAFRAGTFL